MGRQISIDCTTLYQVLGRGRGGQGDPYIEVDGKRVYIENAPKNLKAGDELGIRPNSHRPSPGNADFAVYRDPRELQRQQPRDSETPSPLEQEVYLLYVGTTSAKGDMSAIATLGPDSEYLSMPAYQALTSIIAQHEDPTIFKNSTDRRLAGDLWRIYEKARTDKALSEMEYTLCGQNITPKDEKPLREYFTLEEGKQRAQSQIQRQEPAQQEEVPEAPKRFTAQASQRRPGSPG